jgi:hypothetical protein
MKTLPQHNRYRTVFLATSLGVLPGFVPAIILAAIVVALLSASLLKAQGPGTLGSPPGYLGQESADGSAPYSMLLGGYPAQRFQLADGNLRGKTLALTQAELRRDTQPGFTSPGRSWSRVTLQVGETDTHTFGETFTQNRLGRMTTVFDTSVIWPEPDGLSTQPAPWGTEGLSFPFTTPVVFSGSQDLLLEYEFSGGQLRGGVGWSTGSLRSYYLDGVSGSHQAVSVSTYFGSTACRDSSQQNGAVQRLYVESHAGSSPTHPNQFSHYQESYNTARLAPVLQGIGITGDSTGVATGTCNRLHVAPLVMSTQVADGDGYARMSLGTAPYDSTLVGRSIWAQSAWTDSETRTLKLTNAAQATIMAQPPPLPWRSLIATTTNHGTPLASEVGTVYDSTYVPLHRYHYE